MSTDTIYKALITGCALAGPAGCAAASEGDSPLDVDAKFQALLKAAYDAAKANPAAPLTSGQSRRESLSAHSCCRAHAVCFRSAVVLRAVLPNGLGSLYEYGVPGPRNSSRRRSTK